MPCKSLRTAILCAAIGSMSTLPQAGQSPGRLSDADVPISSRDRVYIAEQFSNTVSVVDPVGNRLLGTIRLGDPSPANFSPLYRGQLLVHGMGYSPDHTTLAVVSVGSNSVSFIDTATNTVKHTTYIGRAPHEAFYTPDGNELWVTVRGENYVSVLDARSFREKGRIETPNGPGMQIFSPDGTYGYVCSSFTPETVVVSVSTHEIVGRVKQESPFCPNIAATPDGKQVWLTLKDVGRTMIFDAKPPFSVIRALETGPITNHVNFAATKQGILAFVTVGGLNQVKVFRTDDFSQIATIAVGKLPHGIWPSGDGTRMFVGLENDDALQVIETASLRVVAQVAIGQAPQALAYVSGAVPEGDGLHGLVPLGVASQVTRLSMSPPGPDGRSHSAPPTSVALFDQGLVQVLEASATGLKPMQTYVLALSDQPDGRGLLQPLATFTTNGAGAAIVNTIGPIRQLIDAPGSPARRYLVIALPGSSGDSSPVQIQVP
jgi:YVTN family beta-propeller protein